MYLQKTAKRNLLHYFDLQYLFKFGLLLICLYGFNMLYIKMTTVGTYIYSPVLTHYLDYVSWIRVSILYVADIIVHCFGLPSYIINAKTLFISRGISVTMDWPCIGLGIMSFWVAYIVAQDSNWRSKLYWSLIGVTAIWFINCWRVGLLLIALAKKTSLGPIDNHSLFNYCCYVIIIALMYWHYKRKQVAEST